MESVQPALQALGITKSFSGNKVLDNVDFIVNKGEIHALLGHNGAGKSTLMKILLGVYNKDDGVILVDQKEVDINNPQEAREAGLAIVHQELNLFPNLSVAENMYLGREFTYSNKEINNSTVLGMVQRINRKRMFQECREHLSRVNLEINPNRPVSDLSMGQRQLLEIAKGLSEKAKVLILDEPTSSLSPHEVKTLFKILKNLASEGVTIIFISHRLDEVFEICDQITILKDGRLVKRLPTKETNTKEVIELMIGSHVEHLYGENKYRRKISKEVILKVKNLELDQKYKNISFEVRKGEIVGLAGLVGAGRTEVLEGIFGIKPFTKGEIEYLGSKRFFKEPSEAVRAGIGFVPEDRKDQGLFLQMNVGRNVSMTVLKELTSLGQIDRKKERNVVNQYINELNIKTTGFNQPITELSGGNQQKVVLSKWFAKGIKLLLLDEPTRGVDVQSKAEIYSLINDFLESGGSVIMVSSELPEVLGMADRIITFKRGRITNEIMAEEANENIVMEMIV